MPEAPREIELKFVIPPTRLAETAAALEPLAKAQPRELTSVYYDTPKGALRRAGMALRVRREGDAFTQTLKDAGDGGLSRGEWEAKLTGPEPDLGLLRGTPAGAVIGAGAKLAPVYVLDVRRRTAVVAEAESRIELALDEGLARARGKEAAFAELELELKSGPTWGLFALARRLAAQGDLTLSFTTKAERGDMLARPPRTRAKKFVVPAFGRDLAAGEAFQQAALACLRQVSVNAERLRGRASPEVIHQFRVGLRRLRSLISSFKTVVADARLPAIKAELKWISGELDAARNLDVLLHGDYRAAVAQKDDADGLKGLGLRLRGARRMAYVRAVEAAESERFRRLLVDLLVWIESGPWTAAEEARSQRQKPVAKFAARQLSRRRGKIVRRRRGFRDLDARERHKLRIQAKKLRYLADAFLGLYDRPKRGKAFIAALKDMQDALGELNDIVVGEQLAHDAAVSPGQAPADSAFVAGRISATQKGRLDPLMVRAVRALKAFEDARPFWS